MRGEGCYMGFKVDRCRVFEEDVVLQGRVHDRSKHRCRGGRHDITCIDSANTKKLVWRFPKRPQAFMPWRRERTAEIVCSWSRFSPCVSSCSFLLKMSIHESGC